MEISSDNTQELMHAISTHFCDIRRWQTEVFQGTEMYFFAGLMIILTHLREQSPGDIASAMPANLDRLPLEGCEMDLLETLFSTLRERGQSDSEIATIARSTATFTAAFAKAMLPPASADMIDGEQPDLTTLQTLMSAAIEQVMSREDQHANNHDPGAPCCPAIVEQQ